MFIFANVNAAEILNLSKSEHGRYDWQTHNNTYLKLIKMTPEELRQFNIINSFGKPNEMWGVPIEIDHNTTGVMIAVDGTEMPLVEGY